MKTKECIGWLWRASAGIRSWIVIESLAGMFHVAASMGFVWFSKSLVDAATTGSDSRLMPLAAGLLSCMLLQVLIGSLESWISGRTDVMFKNRLRHEMFKSMMESRWDGKEAYHTGDALNRVMDDVKTVADSLIVSVPAVVTAAVQFVSAFAFLFILAPGLAWTIPGLLVAMLFISKAYVRRMRRLTKEIRSAESNVQSLMQESLQNRIVIHTLERTPYISDTLAGHQDELQEHVMDKTNYSVFASSFIRIGFSAGYAAAFLWGVFGINDGSTTFGMMTAFLQLVGQIQRPMMNLSRQLPALINSLTSAERLSEISEIPKEETGDPIPMTSAAGIRFENVSYTYPGAANPVLDRLSYDFKPGTITALLGETGAGKSTMMRLMLALLTPQEGRVSIYDSSQSISVTPRTRCNIVYVPQGNTLMSGSIRDNLLLGDPCADEKMMMEALYLAAAEFVADLPEGLDTFCGERGAGLSEGQAQRIAIARALLRKGGLMLLDEPTSSLDADTEHRLLERLSQSAAGRTVIIVTHRQAAASICDGTLSLQKISGA